MNGEQIKVLYEEQGLSVGEIKEIFPEYEEEAIKATLAGNSVKFRKDAEKDSELFSEKDERTAGLVMTQLMLHENENVQFRAAKYIINERKGRHDKSNLKNLSINVNIFNETMKKAREMKERALAKSRENIVDVESSKN